MPVVNDPQGLQYVRGDSMMDLTNGTESPCCRAARDLGIRCACQIHTRFQYLIAQDPDRYIPAVMASSRALAGLPPDPNAVSSPPSREPAPPPLGRQVVNFVRAQIRHVADGRVKASPELLAARLAVCETCPLLRRSDRRCTAISCGCPVDAKATYRSESCPHGRWPDPASFSQENS